MPGSSARRPAGEAGLSLVEVVVALFVLAVLTAAIAAVLIGAVRSIGAMGTRQAAVAVANQQLEYVRALPVGHLLDGRNASDVAALLTTPTLVDLSGDVATSGNSDPAAAPGSAQAAVPLTLLRTVASTTYTVRTFINTCFLSAYTGLCTSSTADGPAVHRVSVDVSWPRPAGVTCLSAAADTCEYVATTLLDASRDPVFTTVQPPTISGLSVLRDGVWVPLTSAVHPGEQVDLTVTGARFTYGSTVYGGAGDVVGAATDNTGTALRVRYRAGSQVGTRSLVLVRPDGASAATTLQVATSQPTVTSVVPAAAIRAVPVTVTLTGTDFLATPSIASPTTLPVVTMTGTAVVNGVSTTIIPVVGAVAVQSAGGLTATFTFPDQPTAYLVSGTLTVVNPDGGRTTTPYAVSVQ